MILLVILGIIVLLVIFTISLYNRLSKAEKWQGTGVADVDVQLKQRHDIDPSACMRPLKGTCSMSVAF